MGHTWGRRLDHWHDEDGPFHLLRENGAPACGVPYFATTGPYPYPEEVCHPRCHRCEVLAAAEARDPRRRATGFLARMGDQEGPVLEAIQGTSDVAYLEALQDAELNGRGRVTVHRHLLRRLHEVRASPAEVPAEV